MEEEAVWVKGTNGASGEQRLKGLSGLLIRNADL